MAGKGSFLVWRGHPPILAASARTSPPHPPEWVDSPWLPSGPPLPPQNLAPVIPWPLWTRGPDGPPACWSLGGVVPHPQVSECLPKRCSLCCSTFVLSLLNCACFFPHWPLNRDKEGDKKREEESFSLCPRSAHFLCVRERSGSRSFESLAYVV